MQRTVSQAYLSRRERMRARVPKNQQRPDRQRELMPNGLSSETPTRAQSSGSAALVGSLGFSLCFYVRLILRRIKRSS
jgi:hypothetical protein